MRGLDRLALARSSEAREDASRGDPQPAETCRRPLAPAPPCSCGRAPPTRQRGSDRPVLALSSSAPPPQSCSVSVPSLARMRTALSVPRCGLGTVFYRLRARLMGGVIISDVGLYLVRMRRNRCVVATVSTGPPSSHWEPDQVSPQIFNQRRRCKLCRRPRERTQLGTNCRTGLRSVFS